MAKRRFINKLPVVNQTETLKKFFGSTVDQVFQPGTSAQISGYIGQKPSYYDAKKDFYIPEPSAARAAYQLEPAMASVASDGTVQSLSFYDDLVNYLRAENAITNDHNRMFGDTFYGWAPPVCPDKLTNFNRYYWFGDDPDLVPALTLTAPRCTFRMVDGATNTFAMPATIAGIDASRETPLALVDGLVAETIVSGDDLVLVEVPAAGATVTTFRYGDLVAVLSGLAQFDPTMLGGTSRLTALTSNMRVRLIDGISAFQGFDTLAYEAVLLDNPRLCRMAVDTPWDQYTRPTTFFVEGVGSAIQMVEFPDAMTFDDHGPQHVTVDRRSRDRNPWTTNNFWVHEDAFRWADVLFPDRRAERPILEFPPHIELFNYGLTRRRDITGTLTGEPRFALTPVPGADLNRGLSDWDVDPFDVRPMEDDGARPTPLSEMNGKQVGQVFVDGGRMVDFGDRILVLGNTNPDLKNTILEIKLGHDLLSIVDENQVATLASTPVIVMMIEEVRPRDVVRSSQGVFVPWDGRANDEAYFVERQGLDDLPWTYADVTVEYHFDGDDWTLAQTAHPEQDPLFALYTTDLVRHDEIPGNAFAGNPLFTFKRDVVTTGSRYDTYLRRVPVYDAKGQIVFDYAQATRHTLVRGEALTGFQLFRVVGETPESDQYCNGWYLTGERSHQALREGTFETPLNLLGNPDNLEVSTIVRNQFFANNEALLVRQPGFSGSPYNTNNYRDVDHHYGVGFTGPLWVAGHDYAVGDTCTKSGVVYRCVLAHTAGGGFDATKWMARPIHKIIQNRSPLLKTMLLASDKRFDYLDACRFMEHEYTRFRNKFVQQTLEVLRTGQRLADDADDLWVETILENLMVSKTPDFPFSLSTMAGGQFYIPPTAAAMGVLPAAEPSVEVDPSYDPPVTFLRGHDGSRTPISGQFQDRILLALERLIWRNIVAQFKSETKPAFDFFDLDEARYRGNGNGDEITSGDPNPCDNNPDPEETGRTTYSRAEIVRMYTPIFIRWAQVNGLDYRANNGYDPSDPFTWNYHGTNDVDGIAMPGSYRAIYRHYFDTDRPNAAPWEMLGFFDKPAWWDAEYGPHPYTAGNLVLWEDLRDGVIRQGPRRGVDVRFARPDLLSILPVDDEGNLRTPVGIGIIPLAPTPERAAAQWQVGDDGPVENLWKLSVSYPFARSQIGYLMRPAEWIEAQWDTQYLKALPDGQWYNDRAHNRPRAIDTTVHREIDPLTGLPQAVYGIQQWIVDMMASRAQDASILGGAIRSIEPRLSHKMAGFTQSDNLRVFADNFGILPEEDITVTLLKSPPIREAVYSGVIVEWTGSGYSVVGYDTTKEGFCVLAGDPNSKSRVISLGTNPDVYEWRGKVYYPMNTLVEHKGSVYRAIRAHTSSLVFEDEFWKPETIKNIRYPKVTVYDGTTGDLTYVPYSTVFKTIQEVATFLWDYGRALERIGFVFDYVDPSTGEIQNWELMIREFLTWAQMDWQPGAFIALSPGASQVKFVTAHGTVYNVEETANGIYGLLDRTGRPLARSATFVSRLDEETKIITLTNDLFAARLRVGEIEHAIVFSNLTIFNDVIYQPLLSLRQPRLRVIGMRTPNWAGRRDAPGFMIETDRVEFNFWSASENLRTMFEIERSEDRTLRDYARHLIGYQTRPYLDNLLVSETEQFEFYQGMIQQKGAPGVFEKLTRSRLIDDQTELKFQEEWGVRVGTFGATDVTTQVGFKLLRSDMRSNPQFVQFGVDDPNDAVLGLPSSSDRWMDRPADYMRVFPHQGVARTFHGITSPAIETETETLPSAGPVRTNEVDYFSFSPQGLTDLFHDVDGGLTGDFDPGRTIWVYDMLGSGTSWNVLRSYRVGDDDTFITRVETASEDPSLGSTMRFTFSKPHGLSRARDLGVYFVVPIETYLTPDASGCYPIFDIPSPTTLLIEATTNAGRDLAGEFTRPLATLLRPQRFDTLAAKDAFYADFPPATYQFAYIDRAPDYDGWIVQIYTGSTGGWKLFRQQPKRIDSRRVERAMIYDLTTQIDGSSIRPEPSRLSRMSIIDPICGLISGRADRELTYKMHSDPASYDSADQWGVEHVGRLWWDLSKVKFLDVQTDIADLADAARYEREITYRTENWGSIAPGSSVDVYEWVRTLDPPSNVGAPGDRGYVDYNTVEEFDADTGQIVQVYYYWVYAPSVVPPHPDRAISGREVAALIADVKNQDQPWVAPIVENGMLVSNVSQYLDDDSTVFQFDISVNAYDGAVHNQYAIVRKGDGSSQPPPRVWTNMRNSLSGFDDFVRAVADASLLPSQKTGNTIRARRSQILPDRQDVLDARRAFVETVNLMFARAPLLVDRPTITAALTKETPSYAKLVWTQKDGTDYIEPPPQNSYDFVAEGIEERDAIIQTAAYAAANGVKGWDTYAWDTGGYEQDYDLALFANNRATRVLMTNFGAAKPSWSIWEGYLGPKIETSVPTAPVNQPPVAVDDGGDRPPYVLEPGERFTITAQLLLGNDFDDDGDPISVVSVGPAPVGSLLGDNVRTGVGSGDGPWVYQSLATDADGAVRIPYTISDDHGNTASAVLTLFIRSRILPEIKANDDVFSIVREMPIIANDDVFALERSFNPNRS